MSNKKVVQVIVNKSWEFEPFFDALTNSKLRPKSLPYPSYVSTQDEIWEKPRAVYENLENIEVIVRCIENMMKPGESAEYYSNSEEKAKYLPKHIQEDCPDFVISVSTAESTPDILPKGTDSINGSVIMGGNFFMYDAAKYNPVQPSPSGLGVVDFQANNVKASFYKAVTPNLASCTKKFIPQKFERCDEMCCKADTDYTSIGVVNIVQYEGYQQGDPAAYHTFLKQRSSSDYIPVSIETTHGIVKMVVGQTFPQRSVPTLFVSPITDRYEHFADDVDDVQNYIAAFNSGIAVGELLAAINENPSII